MPSKPIHRCFPLTPDNFSLQTDPPYASERKLLNASPGIQIAPPVTGGYFNSDEERQRWRKLGPVSTLFLALRPSPFLRFRRWPTAPPRSWRRRRGRGKHSPDFKFKRGPIIRRFDEIRPLDYAWFPRGETRTTRSSPPPLLFLLLPVSPPHLTFPLRPSAVQRAIENGRA